MSDFLKPSFSKIVITLVISILYLFPTLAGLIPGCEIQTGGLDYQCIDSSITPLVNFGLTISFLSLFLLFPITLFIRMSALILPSLDRPLAGNPFAIIVLAFLVILYTYLIVLLIALLFRKKSGGISKSQVGNHS